MLATCNCDTAVEYGWLCSEKKAGTGRLQKLVPLFDFPFLRLVCTQSFLSVSCELDLPASSFALALSLPETLFFIIFRQTVCAVVQDGNWLGFAAFSSSSGLLEMTVDLPRTAPADDGGQAKLAAIAVLCRSREPIAKVICQARLQAPLKEALAEIVGEHGMGLARCSTLPGTLIVNILHHRCTTAANWVQVVPALDFDLRAATRRVSELQLASLRHLSAERRAAHLGLFLTAENQTALRALGGLIKYVERENLVSPAADEAGNRPGEPETAAAFVDLVLTPSPQRMLLDHNAIT